MSRTERLELAPLNGKKERRAMTKTSKRILSVKIKRMVDTDADTSYLGEYSNHATSDYSIDRAHREDCASLEENHRNAVDKLERIISYLDSIRRSPEVADNSDSTQWERLDEAIDILTGLQDESMECDCSGGDMERGEYRYFNPSFNYVDKSGKATDEPENVRKYTRQDYERMESLNRGSWCHIGISAVAEVVTNAGSMSTVQTIHSGGLYGIESDSERSYLESVEQEELASLKSELSAIGFSKRAISKAFNPDSIEEVSR